MLKRLMTILLAMLLIFACCTTGEAESYQRLKKGSRGEAVKMLQTALKDKGYYTGKVDGIYGKSTVNAVKAFQKDNGLETDGIAGIKTQELLYQKGVAAATTDDVEQGIGTAAFLDPYTEDGTISSGSDEKATIPEDVTGFLQSIADNSGASCGTIVLSKNGAPFLTWSFGGVSEKTCFRIASITKWVTAIGLMTLYDAGKLDLDKDISQYLGFTVRNPAYPNTPITARMILSHTSSLSPNASDYHPDWARIGKKGYDPLHLLQNALKP